MEILIITACIALVGGAITPLPQRPGPYLQLQPPIKPTQPSNSTTGGAQAKTADVTVNVEQGNMAKLGTLVSTAKFAAVQPLNPGTEITTSVPLVAAINNKDSAPAAVSLTKSAEVGAKTAIDASATGTVTSDLNTSGNNAVVDTSNAFVDPNAKIAIEADLKRTDIKNRDNVPTANELIKSGISPVDVNMMQTRVEDTVPAGISFTNTVNANASLSAVSTNEVKPAVVMDDKSKALKGDAVDPEADKKRTDIKNRDNVPTADELMKSGMDPAEIPFMQVRIEGPPPGMDTKPVTKPKVTEEKDKAFKGDAVDPEADKKPTVVKTDDNMQMPAEFAKTKVTSKSTAIKNRENTLSLEEAKAAGIDPDVVPFQVRIEDTIPAEFAKTKVTSTASITSLTDAGKVSAPLETAASTSDSTSTNAMSSPSNVGNAPSLKVESQTKLSLTTTMQPVPEPSMESQATQPSGKITAIESPVVTEVSDNSTTSTNDTQAASPTVVAGSVDTQQTAGTNGTESSTSQPIEMTTGCQPVECTSDCPHGRKVDYKGCATCDCKFSDACPPVLPVSRLLCLLQVRSSLSCVTDADCKKNRICCPGTCGSMCRRRSNRRRAMLLSILDGAL